MKKLKMPIPPRAIEMALTSKILVSIPKNLQINSFSCYSLYEVYILSKLGYNIVGFTDRYVIKEFWSCFSADKERVLKIGNQLLPSINQFTFPINQKNWALYDDPFVRSAYFLLLCNLSTEKQASCGNLINHKYFTLSYPDIKESLFNIKIIKENKVYEESLNCCNVVNGGVFNTNLLSKSESSGIDTMFFNSVELINKYKNMFEPWIIGFYRDERIEKYSQNLNISYFDSLGNPTKKEESKVWLLSNV